MSTQGVLTSSPSSSSTHWWTYDVFLSFRGEDTRKTFTSYLSGALKRKGIWTFRDDEKLERGNTISKELLKAIEKSRFAIVIFSENYASSKWCLDELVHIVRCKKETGLKVLPVFYHVNPSDVRKQRGTFAQVFKEHKKRFGRSFLERSKRCKSEKMKKWRFALREVANIAGWDLQNR